MKKINLIGTVVLVISIFVLNACQKVNDAKDILSAEEVSTANNLFNDVFKQINEAAKLISEQGTQKSTYATYHDGGCASINKIGRASCRERV